MSSSISTSSIWLSSDLLKDMLLSESTKSITLSGLDAPIGADVVL